MHARVVEEIAQASRDPFLRQLPQRLTRLRQRGQRFGHAGWDINALRILADDAALIAGVCRSIDAIALARILDDLCSAAASLLDPARLPDRAAATHLAGLIDRLSREPLPSIDGAFGATDGVVVPGALRDNGFPLLVTPPPTWWTRFDAIRAPRAHPTPAAPAEPASRRDAVSPGPSIAERRNGDRRAAAREQDREGELPILRESLLQHVSQCLAGDDAFARGGGVLLLVADDSVAHNAASDEARSGEIGRFLNAQMVADECAAMDAPGQFLLFDPDRDTGLLEAWALTLRERIARAAFGSEDAPEQALFDIGVCPFTIGIHGAEAMCAAARNAIDSARTDGRHGVFVARSGDAPINIELVERIRYALDANGLEVLFQPIVSLQGDETGQFQVLLRLRDDRDVVHTAAEVIPAATQAGLIEAVDRWVLAHCIALLGRQASQIQRPRLFVSQSLASVRDAQASMRLRGILAEHRVAASAIVLELHSADAARAPAETGRYSAAMQALGARLALSGFDDVRDAHLLDALRPGFVKLEPQLLQIGDAETRDGLRIRIGALHERGVRVIAPRVEDARGAAALCSAGIDFIQGNFVQAAESELVFDFQESVM